MGNFSDMRQRLSVCQVASTRLKMRSHPPCQITRILKNSHVALNCIMLATSICHTKLSLDRISWYNNTLDLCTHIYTYRTHAIGRQSCQPKLLSIQPDAFVHDGQAKSRMSKVGYPKYSTARKTFSHQIVLSLGWYRSPLYSESAPRASPIFAMDREPTFPFPIQSPFSLLFRSH